MATFVLVHGSMHRGWCWKRVVLLLRAASHEVFAPTLTGLGERAHLAHPGIDLDTHVRDVLGVLEYEDLGGVVLVGHSYGAVVITGVADRLPDRIARVRAERGWRYRELATGHGAVIIASWGLADLLLEIVRAAPTQLAP